MLLNDFLPWYEIAERHGIAVRAPTDRTYEAVRRIDLARSRPVRALFAVRGLPRLARDRHRGPQRTMAIDDLVKAGFVILGEQPGAEIVLGLVGQFWKPRGAIRRVDPAGFAAFEEPGYAKAGWNFRVEQGEDGSTVTTETRIRCTDERSRRRFVLYWAVVGPFSAVIRKQALAMVKADAEGAEPPPGP